MIHSLSLCSTCFYALCLISHTPQGADALLTHGWTSIRHSREEKWPLILSEAIDNVIKTQSSPLSPTTSFSSVIGGGSDVSGSPSRRRQCTVLCVRMEGKPWLGVA